MSKYKKIENMTTGQVIDLVSSGEAVYLNDDGEGFYEIFTEGINISSIESWLIHGKLYTEEKSDWWEGFENCLVMVRDEGGDEWVHDAFREYDYTTSTFECKHFPWKQARPLTAAERDAIKTVD